MQQYCVARHTHTGWQWVRNICAQGRLGNNAKNAATAELLWFSKQNSAGNQPSLSQASTLPRPWKVLKASVIASWTCCTLPSTACWTRLVFCEIRVLPLSPSSLTKSVFLSLVRTGRNEEMCLNTLHGHVYITPQMISVKSSMIMLFVGEWHALFYFSSFLQSKQNHHQSALFNTNHH